MTAFNKQALTDEVISQAFTGTNFGRDDLKNILSETVIDAAAGWRCGYTATTICTQLGLLTATGRASALGLRFVSEHVQRETKRLKDELEAAEERIAELEAEKETLRPVGVMSEGAFRRLENSESRFIALWPRPGIYLPRKRPDDGVIVYARTAAGIGVKGD